MRGSEDQTITQQLNNKLATRGLGSPCHVTVQCNNGAVTLSGSVQDAHQKGSAVKVAAGIQGVRRVINQLTVKPLTKK
jgi:hyperosmotically inducible protein